MTKTGRESIRSALYRIADGIVDVMRICTSRARGEATPGLPEPGSADPFAGLPPILAAHETAKLLRVGTNTAYEGIRSGRIPSVRVGSRIVVLVAQQLATLGAARE